MRKGSMTGDEAYSLATRSQRIRPAAEHEYGQCYVIGGQR
jgi:hypothetical protein